jgi:hypothetical protein
MQFAIIIQDVNSITKPNPCPERGHNLIPRSIIWTCSHIICQKIVVCLRGLPNNDIFRRFFPHLGPRLITQQVKKSKHDCEPNYVIMFHSFLETCLLVVLSRELSGLFPHFQLFPVEFLTPSP